MTNMQSQADNFNHQRQALTSIDECAAGIDGIAAVLVLDSCNATDINGYERIGKDIVLDLCSALQELANRIRDLSDQAGSQL